MLSNIHVTTALELLSKHRNILISDTKDCQSANLYSALYSNTLNTAVEIKFNLYELQIVQRLWENMLDTIKSHGQTTQQKKAMLAFFSEALIKYFNLHHFSPDISSCIEGKIEILRKIVQTNDKWEEHVELLKVSFMGDIKVLHSKIVNSEG